MSPDTPAGADGPDPGTDAGDPATDTTLSVGEALASAAARLARPGGLLLLAGYLFVGFAGAVARESLFGALRPALTEAARTSPNLSPSDVAGFGESPLALPTDPATGVAMVLATALLAEALSVVAVRTFVREARRVPGEVLSDLGPRTGASFVANVFARVAVFAGLLLFVLPGLFLAVAFYLVRPVIAVEGSGVVPGLRRSWRLTKGTRPQVLLVLLTVFLVTQAAALPATLVGTGGAAATVGATLGVLFGAVASTFGAAVAARVYVQLAGGTAVTDAEADVAGHDTARGSEPEATEEPLGALSPEEIDERFGDGDDRR